MFSLHITKNSFQSFGKSVRPNNLFNLKQEFSHTINFARQKGAVALAFGYLLSSLLNMYSATFEFMNTFDKADA